MNKKQSFSNHQEAFKSLQECFLNFNPEESKELLWRMFAALTLGTFSGLPQDEKENFFAFYKHLEKVLEVAGDLATEGEEEGGTAQSRVFKNIPKNPE